MPVRVRSSEGLGRALGLGPSGQPPMQPALGRICDKQEGQNEEPVVVLKSGLAHSYREIDCLDQCNAFDNRGQGRNLCNPERALLLRRKCSTAARRQAKEDAERECAKRDSQQSSAKENRCCGSTNGPEKCRAFERHCSGCLNVGSDAL
jgi:hypothetical protein